METPQISIDTKVTYEIRRKDGTLIGQFVNAAIVEEETRKAASLLNVPVETFQITEVTRLHAVAEPKPKGAKLDAALAALERLRFALPRENRIDLPSGDCGCQRCIVYRALMPLEDLVSIAKALRAELAANAFVVANPDTLLTPAGKRLVAAVDAV